MIYLNIEILIGENFGMSIKICTVYFEGRYTPDYVEKIYNGLKKYCTLPFEFICYSDNPNVKADVVIPLPKDSKIKRHWHKLSFFNPEFANQEEGDEIIIMDIDQIIENNIDSKTYEVIAQSNERIPTRVNHQLITGYKNTNFYYLTQKRIHYKFR